MNKSTNFNQVSHTVRLVAQREYSEGSEEYESQWARAWGKDPNKEPIEMVLKGLK